VTTKQHTIRSDLTLVASGVLGVLNVATLVRLGLQTLASEPAWSVPTGQAAQRTIPLGVWGPLLDCIQKAENAVAAASTWSSWQRARTCPLRKFRNRPVALG
jgi:hypothetical protein